MSKTLIKTVQAKSITQRVPIAYCGTADAPERPVHATAYKRGDGAITIARADKKTLEVRPTDRVRISYDPVAVKAKNLRWCKGGTGEGTCPEPHLKRIGTDKAASAYCDRMLKWYREHPATLADVAAYRDAARTEGIARRIGRALDREAPSRERMIASVMRARLTTYGPESRQLAAAAKDYGMTVAEALDLVAEEYDVQVPTASA